MRLSPWALRRVVSKLDAEDDHGPFVTRFTVGEESPAFSFFERGDQPWTMARVRSDAE
jgi:hypothetical protein